MERIDVDIPWTDVGGESEGDGLGGEASFFLQLEGVAFGSRHTSSQTVSSPFPSKTRGVDVFSPGFFIWLVAFTRRDGTSHGVNLTEKLRLLYCISEAVSHGWPVAMAERTRLNLHLTVLPSTPLSASMLRRHSP